MKKNLFTVGNLDTVFEILLKTEGVNPLDIALVEGAWMVAVVAVDEEASLNHDQEFRSEKIRERLEKEYSPQQITRLEELLEQYLLKDAIVTSTLPKIIVARVMLRTGNGMFSISEITIFLKDYCVSSEEVAEILSEMDLDRTVQKTSSDGIFKLTEKGVALAKSHWIQDYVCPDHQCSASGCGCLGYIQSTHCHECGSRLSSGHCVSCESEREMKQFGEFLKAKMQKSQTMVQKKNLCGLKGPLDSLMPLWPDESGSMSRNKVCSECGGNLFLGDHRSDCKVGVAISNFKTHLSKDYLLVNLDQLGPVKPDDNLPQIPLSEILSAYAQIDSGPISGDVEKRCMEKIKQLSELHPADKTLILFCTANPKDSVL